jgi:pectate lyase
LDCGGKRSATPLLNQTNPLGGYAKALSPLRSASAVQIAKVVCNAGKVASVHHLMKAKVLLLATFVSTIHFASAQTNLAFPNAEGFGRFASGGSGGETVHVTTLADSGSGSFREAVSKPHRVVVFDVSGIVRLKSNVAVSSDISILGDTAPDSGITFYGRSVSFSDRQNIIVRYVRFREGIAGDKGKCSVGLTSGADMIFDHCSIEWGRWDCLGLTRGSHDITFQNCIIGEGVDPQRFGSLSDSVTNITYTHNLWINNQSRNPKAKGKIQYVNNVVYNWGVCGLVGGHSAGDHFQDVVGNYFIAGPNSGKHGVGECAATDHIFLKGNFVDLDKDGKLNGRELVATDCGSGEGAPTFVDTPSNGSLDFLKIEPAEAALKTVLESAGCSLHRDAVDARLIEAVKSFGTRGKIIHSEAEVGGL